MSNKSDKDGGENVVREAEIVDLVQLAGPSAGKLLTRSQAAKLLEISVSTLRRMEGAELKPVLGPDGVHYFVEAEIQTVRIRLSRLRAPEVEQNDGSLAARAFELFRGGADVIAVVRELREPPEKIEKLFKQWQKLRGITFFDPGPLVGDLCIDVGPEGLATEAGLLAAVQNYMKRASPRCVLCDRRGYWCRSCAQKTGLAQEAERKATKLF